MEKEPKVALEMLAEAEAADLPKCASVCEHFIVKSFRKLPLTDLDSISKEACLRILRGVAQQRDAGIDKLDRYSGYVPAAPSADTMLTWR